MKTIKQIADEIGVSRQAVHKKIKQEPLSTSLQEFMSTKNNVVYISVDGINLVKTAFLKDSLTTNSVNQLSTMTTQYMTSLQNQIDFLAEQNQDLREQLNKERDHSREQTDKLSNLAAQLAELTRNNQILLGAEQSRTNSALLNDNLTSEQSEKNSHKKRWQFWKRNS